MSDATNIVEANDQTFAEETATGIVVVDFFAEWCMPCKMLMPVLEKIAENNPDVKIVKVDIDGANDTALEHQVSAVPTIKILKDGEVVEELVGMQSESAIEEAIEKAQG